MADLLSESRSLSELLLSSGDLARNVFAEISAGLDIPVAVARALCLLEKPESMSGLALKHRCDKSYITPLTDQMEALGYVKRVPGPDRRTKMIELTKKGQTTRDKLELEIANLSPMMNRLTKSERQTLKSLLEKVAVERV
jgi:DNA-binding MarR family transcriptional regulator